MYDSSYLLTNTCMKYIFNNKIKIIFFIVCNSIIIYFAVVTVMYLIMPMIVFAAYGDETNLHFLNHISEIERRSGFRLVIEIINIIQIATTFIIILIPTMHAFEERLNCPLGKN